MACKTSPGQTAEIFGAIQEYILMRQAMGVLFEVDGSYTFLRSRAGTKIAGVPRHKDGIDKRDNTRVNIAIITASLVMRPRPKSAELRIVRKEMKVRLNDLGLLMSALLVMMKSLVPNAIDWQEWS
ncbi:hypothetical protein BY996DRAFT_6561989 [Phakopsora pachyrhizi]|nr:hypothetical protein BY996DRAFT_6561989 [Phakopsora pachyrhizi]